tara:strand:+ start:391 stop:570 length:180 start_codon:yes stop_codon:yes gene_type:complete
MARVTRLELAASAVTGRRSNQLSYTRAFKMESLIPPYATIVKHVLAKKRFFSIYFLRSI